MARSYLFLLLLMLLYSCDSRYTRYHARWIVEEYEVNGIDARYNIGVFNLKIDLNRKLAFLPGLYMEDSTYMVSGADVPLSISTKGKQDFIYFSGHPIIQGAYTIDCIDRNCCHLLLKNDSIAMKLVYNGDITFGKERDCE